MKLRTILPISALLAVAAGIVVLTGRSHSSIAGNASGTDPLFASMTDATRSSGPPPMPASFYGTVTVDEADAPEGTQVSAWIDGVMYAETHTFLFEGKAVYALDVPADDSATPEVEGGRPGDTIVFYVSELQADQTGPWQGGTNTELNLSASSSAPCILFLPLVLRQENTDQQATP